MVRASWRMVNRAAGTVNVPAAIAEALLTNASLDALPRGLLTGGDDPVLFPFVEPHVHHCPRCGAPLPVRPGAWAVRCNFCEVDVSLLGPSPQPNRDASLGPVPPPPSPAAIRRRKALLPICTGLFGVLAMPTAYFLDRNDKTDRAAAIAVVASILAFVLYGTGRRLWACFLALPVGIVLLAKPFVRPVLYDGRPHSLNSETHYYFLIPGIAMLAVFGLLCVGILERREFAAQDSVRLRVVAGAFFIAGLVGGHFAFGGPTIADALKLYESQGIAMRKQLFNFAKSLPAVGEVVPQESKLDPTPVWLEGQREKNNIEIVMVEELWNPDESPKGRNLYLSDELMHGVRWTGPKNPMSSSVMGDQAGDFAKRMNRAFGLPWIAAYRPGKAGIEVFVYDLRAGRLAIATIAKGTLGDYERDRKVVLEALAKATGGTFQLK